MRNIRRRVGDRLKEKYQAKGWRQIKGEILGEGLETG